VWDATTRELLTLKGHINSVWSVAFSPDGNQVVTGIAGANARSKLVRRANSVADRLEANGGPSEMDRRRGRLNG
jgi:WD40 repeat protein